MNVLHVGTILQVQCVFIVCYVCVSLTCFFAEDSLCFVRFVQERPSRRSSYCFSCAQMQIREHFARWKKSVAEANCAAMLRRLIQRGPPVSLADVDETIVLEETEKPFIYGCVVSKDGKEWVSGRLDGAPSTAEERDKMWAELKVREQELPEKPEDDEQDKPSDGKRAREGEPIV